MRGYLLIALLIAATAGAQSAPSGGVDACTGTWSAPMAIRRADGRPVYIERGVIAPLGERTIVLGAPTFFWLGRDHMAPPEKLTDTAEVVWSFTRAGAFVDREGVSTGIPLPDTLRRRTSARLIRASGLSVQVAWEATDSMPARGTDPRSSRIDLATFDGRMWTAPRTVIRAERVTLTSFPAMRPRSGAEPTVIAADAWDSTGSLLALARQRGDRWITTAWRDGDVRTSASATELDDGATAVVMMGQVGGTREGVYAFRVTWAGDSARWSAPVLLDSLTAMWSEFSWARLGRDSLVVVWYDQTIGGMKTALSVDGARSWTLTAPLMLSGSMDTQVLVVDADGNLHVVYRGAREDGVLNAPGAIMHSMWRSGAWTTPVAASAGDSMTGPAAGAAAGGGIMTLWTEATFASTGIMPKSLASHWTAECATSR